MMGYCAGGKDLEYLETIDMGPSGDVGDVASWMEREAGTDGDFGT